MEKYILSIFGSSVDSFYESECYPIEGDFSHTRFVENQAGGPCLNMSAVAASKNVKAKALDMLGKDDETTSFLINKLKEYNIDSNNVIIKENVTNGKVLIIITGDKRTMFVIDPVRPYYDVDKTMQKELNNATFIYSMLHMINRSFKNIEPLLLAKKNGARIIIDGSSKYDDPKRVEMLYALVDGMFINETDYQRLKDNSVSDPMKIILTDNNKFIVITKGEKGSTLYLKDQQIQMPAVANLDVVDSTGAGDSFAGTFLASLINGYDYRKALYYATLNGAYACTKFGGQAGVVSYSELDKFAKEYNYDIR